MFIFFASAGVLFSVARPTPKPKPITPSKPKMILASPATPVLTKAIASFSSRIVVDLSEAKVKIYWGEEQLLSSYPVAVGQPGWETPTGTFKIGRKQRNPAWKQPITGELIPTGPDNPLGDRWIAFWSDGQHQIGFHGTNKEQLVGQAVSHGCLRMRNKDIRQLYEQVSVGTQVVVRK
jgi:lipoprotein-anchoring transpeptidase ErfK/SrfK